jgi:hypothetical protein
MTFIGSPRTIWVFEPYGERYFARPLFWQVLRAFVRPMALSGHCDRTPPSRGGDPLQDHQPTYIVDEVLQTDLGQRPYDADGARDPAPRCVFLRAEDVLDARADLALAAVSSCCVLDSGWQRRWMRLLKSWTTRLGLKACRRNERPCYLD